MSTNTHIWTLSALILVLSSAGAQAQPAPTSAAPTQSTRGWNYSLGAALISAPRFVGSDKWRTLAVPNFDIQYGNGFFINPIRGVGVEVQLLEGLKGSASAGVSFDTRKAKDDARLTGLGNISAAPAIRLGLDHELGDAFVNGTLISRLGNSNERGTLFEADVGYKILASRSGVLAVGLQVKAMDATYARNFFGVSAQQSAASGLPVFHANGGLQSIGPFVQTVLPVSERWTFFGRAAYSKLRSDAAASPITVERNQIFLLGTLNYTF